MCRSRREATHRLPVSSNLAWPHRKPWCHLYKGGSLPPQLLIHVDTKMVNLFGQCIQTKQTKSRVTVWQNDRVSPLKSVMSVRCRDHLLQAEVRGYVCFLPLLLAFIKTLHLLFGSFLVFFSPLFCSQFRDALQDKTAFQFRNAPKLFVCLRVCFNTMYEHW